MNTEMIQSANFWASVYASVACMIFATLYTLITPWWKTPTGRLIMMMMGGLAGLASLSVVFQAWEDLDLVRAIRFVLIAVVGTAVWGHVISLFRVQWLNRQEARQEKQDRDDRDDLIRPKARTKAKGRHRS